ncbi:RICIN domain-containing protein [Streptomyces sp. NPDC006798]|uniref:RICIN domain-containing protein n=1 Tax=Streptomyces sp. NPDC006798 TaxID=3155462 RepID=UPI0033E70061
MNRMSATARPVFRAAVVLAALTALGPGMVPTAAAETAVRAGTYTVSVLHSGKCLGPRGNSAADGALIVQQPCDGRPSQRVTLVATGGYEPNTFLFRTASGKCWDVQGDSKDSYTPIIQHTCHGRWNQWFTPHDDQHPWTGSVLRTGTGGWTDRDRWRVLHVYNASTADDTHLIQYAPHNSWGAGAKNDTFLFHPA